MNRRSFLRARSSAPVLTTLNPYSGPWTYTQAAHLLRRATYGPTHAEILQAVEDGLELTLAKLLTPPPAEFDETPLYFNFGADPNAGNGETWVDFVNSAVGGIINRREDSLQAWVVGRMLNSPVSLHWKMVLFWHDHFVIDDVAVNDPIFQWRYLLLLHEFATGDFREFTKRMTVNPAMLRYLNGDENRVGSPNENYARELLELFTVGKGDLAGPGDYTTFTEDDVIELAKALTGWVTRGYRTLDPDQYIGELYRPNRHDTSTKTLSHRFDNAVIENNDENEYQVVIDTIFQSPHVATHLARRLYRYFVYYDISATEEATIIEPLAQIIRDNDYQVVPALEALLSSQEFFDILNFGPMIKNPYELTVSSVRTMEYAIPNAYQIRYQAWSGLSEVATGCEMRIFNAPNVAGWPAYYQQPVYYRTWINAVTLRSRTAFLETACGGFTIFGQTIKPDWTGIIAQFENPTDPNDLIADLVTLFLPQPLVPGQIDYLKDVLLGGLPDFEWTVEYGMYLETPDDPGLAMAIETKLTNLMRALTGLPEFQLM